MGAHGSAGYTALCLFLLALSLGVAAFATKWRYRRQGVQFFHAGLMGSRMSMVQDLIYILAPLTLLMSFVWELAAGINPDRFPWGLFATVHVFTAVLSSIVLLSVASQLHQRMLAWGTTYRRSFREDWSWVWVPTIILLLGAGGMGSTGVAFVASRSPSPSQSHTSKRAPSSPLQLNERFNLVDIWALLHFFAVELLLASGWLVLYHTRVQLDAIPLRLWQPHTLKFFNRVRRMMYLVSAGMIYPLICAGLVMAFPRHVLVQVRMECMVYTNAIPLLLACAVYVLDERTAKSQEETAVAAAAAAAAVETKEAATTTTAAVTTGTETVAAAVSSDAAAAVAAAAAEDVPAGVTLAITIDTMDAPAADGDEKQEVEYEDDEDEDDEEEYEEDEYEDDEDRCDIPEAEASPLRPRSSPPPRLALTSPRMPLTSPRFSTTSPHHLLPMASPRKQGGVSTLVSPRGSFAVPSASPRVQSAKSATPRHIAAEPSLAFDALRLPTPSSPRSYSLTPPSALSTAQSSVSAATPSPAPLADAQLMRAAWQDVASVWSQRMVLQARGSPVQTAIGSSSSSNSDVARAGAEEAATVAAAAAAATTEDECEDDSETSCSSTTSSVSTCASELSSGAYSLEQLSSPPPPSAELEHVLQQQDQQQGAKHTQALVEPAVA